MVNYTYIVKSQEKLRRQAQRSLLVSKHGKVMDPDSIGRHGSSACPAPSKSPACFRSVFFKLQLISVVFLGRSESLLEVIRGL